MVDKENLGDNSMSSKPVGELRRGSSFSRDHHILCLLATRGSSRPRDTAREKQAYMLMPGHPDWVGGVGELELAIPGLQASVCSPRCC